MPAQANWRMCPAWTKDGDACSGLVNSPERKRATRFETWIPVINEVQAAIVVRADRRLLFPEGQGVE